MPLLSQYEIDAFLFQAFDEDWKIEGGVGPHWGIYRTDRNPKLVASVVAEWFGGTIPEVIEITTTTETTTVTVTTFKSTTISISVDELIGVNILVFFVAVSIVLPIAKKRRNYSI